MTGMEMFFPQAQMGRQKELQNNRIIKVEKDL